MPVYDMPVYGASFLYSYHLYNICCTFQNLCDTIPKIFKNPNRKEMRENER